MYHSLIQKKEIRVVQLMLLEKAFGNCCTKVFHVDDSSRGEEMCDKV